MKYYKMVLLVLSMIFSLSFQSNASANDFDGKFQKYLGIDSKGISSFRSHPAIKRYIQESYSSGDESQGDEVYDPIADYETELLHATQPRISPFERIILSAYLDNPQDVVLAKFLAFHHLSKSLLRAGHGKRKAKSLKHTIIAQYFLNRVQDLGENRWWIKKALERTDRKLSRYFKNEGKIDSSENHEAHQFFIETFNYHEESRYIAYRKLLRNFVDQPNNIFTAFQIMALNVWVGGEANYDDPTVLYNFVIAGYFSVHTISTAKRMEDAWVVDPENNNRFRLAPILGGLSISARRWLAKLHGDSTAVTLIDQEHREWLALHPKFHGFTVGAAFFEENENFMEGFAAWSAMVEQNGCEGVRTCMDRPRFSFNLLGVFLGYVDYLLKLGATDAAQFFLSFRYNPFFQYENWDLGQAAWEQRENNLFEIADLYANDDPNDDPLQFFLTNRKWSSNTSNCQTCHQAQSRFWTEEEKETVIPHLDEILTIGDWPVVSTTWYGSSQ